MAKVFPRAGDKIHFRKDLKVGQDYGILTWLDGMDMLPYLKDEVTVEEVTGNISLRLEEDSDDIKWFFSPEMFVEYTEDKQPGRKQAMENKKMLTKYRAGDKVMVRDDLEIGNYYSGGNYTHNCVVEDMADFKGKVVTIARVCEDGEYELEEDDSPCAYSWTDGMFAYLAEPRYKVGDRVVVRKDLVTDKEYGLDKLGAECCFASGMEEYLGKTLTIIYVNVNEGGWHRYNVKEDLYEWSWTDDMFEGLAEEPPVTDPMANLSADEESFDCSLAEECLFNGRVVCVESDDDSVIERGDMITVKDGRFAWNGRKFDHVFGVSGIIFGFNEVFDTSVEFVRVMEES